jgi:hypothetical protein
VQLFRAAIALGHSCTAASAGFNACLHKCAYCKKELNRLNTAKASIAAQVVCRFLTKITVRAIRLVGVAANGLVGTARIWGLFHFGYRFDTAFEATKAPADPVSRIVGRHDEFG